jgi:hypothetical protein
MRNNSDPFSREAIIASFDDIAQLARDIAQHPDIGRNKITLEREIDLFATALQAIIEIIDHHSALIIWTAKFSEHFPPKAVAGLSKLGPYDPDGLVRLSSALSAAFSIGGHVMDNPIMKRHLKRLEEETRRAQTAHGRQARLRASKAHDAVIEREAQRMLAHNSNLGISKIANSMAASEAVPLKASAIEKRLRILEGEGRLKFRTTKHTSVRNSC